MAKRLLPVGQGKSHFGNLTVQSGINIIHISE